MRKCCHLVYRSGWNLAFPSVCWSCRIDSSLQSQKQNVIWWQRDGCRYLVHIYGIDVQKSSSWQLITPRNAWIMCIDDVFTPIDNRWLIDATRNRGGILDKVLHYIPINNFNVIYCQICVGEFCTYVNENAQDFYFKSFCINL